MEAATSRERVGAIVASDAPRELHARRGGYADLVRHRRAVALGASASAALAFAVYSSAPDRLIAAMTAAVLVVVAATDLERRVIPNRVVLPATVVVLVGRVASQPGHALEWLLAAAGAGLLFLLPNLVNGSAIGMGDVKLAIFLGAGLGIGVVGALIVAFVSMFPFALGMLIRTGLAARKAALPFAPFLALGGLVILIVPRLVGVGGS
jgi:leader peptidase (prepilin peptidase)/N-methyltransferase